MSAHYTRTTRRGRKSRFTLEQIEAMQRDKDAGMSVKELAAKYRTPKQYMDRLLKGENGPRLGAPVKPTPIPRQARPECASYHIPTLKARGFKLTQIAAITGRPYREIEAELSKRAARQSAIMGLV